MRWSGVRLYARPRPSEARSGIRRNAFYRMTDSSVDGKDYLIHSSKREDYFAHFGILGQKWGVRRFQNEDGTLTEEGKQRYRDNYDAVEKKAYADLALAEKQKLDLAKNGWNAKSVFEKGFKERSERNLGRKLDDEDLRSFSMILEQDVSDAKASLSAVKEARNFMERNSNVTLDDILEESERIDKKHSTKFTDDAKKVAKSLGLEEKKQKLSMPEYDKETERLFKSTYSGSDMKNFVNSFMSSMPKDVGNEVRQMKINGKRFDDLSLDQQFYVLYNLVYNNE